MKNNHYTLVLLVLLSFCSLQSQTIFEKPLSPRNANYEPRFYGGKIYPAKQRMNCNFIFI